jgi:hypothetical protein
MLLNSSFLKPGCLASSEAKRNDQLQLSNYLFDIILRRNYNMSLFEQWKEIAGKERKQEEYDAFWSAYFEKEKENYEVILEKKENKISGKLNDLAANASMDVLTFVGFIDGINTSLVTEVKLDELVEDSDIDMEIDFEKLYFNMLEAKADWLYNLPQWEPILTEEKRNQITKEFRVSKMAVSNKIGRNEACTCGSGKKYKKCCGK